MNTRKVFITGGHVTPALAVISRIKREKPDWEVVFLGRIRALESDREDSEEFKLVRALHIRFLPVTTGRIQRFFTAKIVLSLLKIPIGFFQGLWYCIRERPDVILSFGGYVAVPVCVSAWVLGIPVVTHEQTRVMGLANRFISLFAHTVCVSFEEAGRKAGKKGAVVYTGLPIRDELFHAPVTPSFSIGSNLPILFVTGGVTGALAINEAVHSVLPILIQSFIVVHQVGSGSIDAACVWQSRVDREYRSRYIPFRFLNVSDLAWVYKHAEFVICRSGANTIGELLLLQKPGLCIPLPWSGADEQRQNAYYLEASGLGKVLEQKDVTPNSFIHAIDDMHKHIRRYTLKQEYHVAEDPAGNILSLINRIFLL